MIDSERTVVASLIDPKTRPAALDVCEKTGLTTEMFADTKDGDVNPTAYVHTKDVAVKAGDKMSVDMATGGGFVIKFTK